MKNISLIGMMGSGKTTVGKHLATCLNMNCVDLDNYIETNQKLTVSEIFDKFGEKYFRNLESESIHNLISDKDRIFSLGGGAFESSYNRKLLLENSIVIYLRTDADEIFKRLKNDNTRPLLKNMSVEVINNLIMNRQNNYEKAHYIVETNDKAIEKIVDEIIGVIHAT